MIYLFIYILIGAVAGSLSGLLGIGGGVIVIPCLAWVFKAQHMQSNLIMHMAAGTSLAAMVLTAASSLRGHLKRGAKAWPVYRQIVGGIIIGTILGAIFGHLLPSKILEILFGLFMLIMSIRMLLAMKSKPTRKLPALPGMTIAGLLIGGKSGILGIGGGAITIPFLTYCNVPVRNTVAISVATSLTIAIIGTISFMLTGQYAAQLPIWSTGYIYWPAVLGLVISAPLCAQLGVALSHKLPVATLKRILGAILLLMAIRMLI